MIEEARKAEHAAVGELLPWYVNETLSAVERARVRRHLDECDRCRENVTLLSAVRAAVSRPAATPIVQPRRPDLLLAAIDRADRPGRRSWWSPAAIAAASVAVVTLALTLTLVDRQSGVSAPSVYQTSTSGPPSAKMDYVMDLDFEPGVGAEDRQRILRELAAEEVRRDDVSGVYQVNVTLTAASLDELETFTNGLEALPEVRSARIVALQLPMQREP